MRSVTKLALLWSLTFIAILLIMIFTPKEIEMNAVIAFLASTAIFSLGLTVTILMAYAD